ncbi:M48 family metallopeptidase [Fusobacterium sp. oral taxon 203]|uniref:M48 family metallopeptidase n=1 Tax=Fusobacterium sp. oral taxon 203 TaxID=671211 RepID=UPI000B92E866|nr:SprT family zinc-dependent metalloprotease [Fusobacterium sp. oral taxon 203]ASS39954.1 zinc protease [Fusobacterium sp. oral taxon 203]
MEYTVTKKRIKNFIIKIYPDLRIAVSVPLHASNKDIENFIQSKKEWVEITLKKIKKVKENKNNLKENIIKILGKEIEKKIIESDLERIRLTDTSIYIYLKNINNAEIEKKLLEWKIEKLKAILDEYLTKYTKLLNRNINYYQIKKLSSAWGIYHKKENYISFNFDLIEKDIECIEYVVLHELCHIFYMNHQKNFWTLLEKYMPDYKIRRKKLKTFI